MKSRYCFSIVIVLAAFCVSFAEGTSDNMRAAQIVAERVARETAQATVTEAVSSAAAKAAKETVESMVKEAVDKAATAAAAGKSADEQRRENGKQIETRVFKLAHASAEEVAENLNAMWNGDFGVNWKITKMAVPFKESNSVMVTAPRLILDACALAVKQLDIEAPQVYIEARFVELGNTASHKIGIDWSMLGGMTGTATLGGGLQGYGVGKGVKNYTKTITSKGETTSYALQGITETTKDASGNPTTLYGDSDASISYFNGTLNFSQMALTLKALEATQDSKTFSNPKIIVSSGKKAIVDMTRKYPNVQIAAKKTINNNNESVDLDMKMAAIPGEDKFMFAREAFFSWGIALEVVPRIGTNGLINVTIVPTISECSEFVTAGTASGGDSSDSSSYSSRYPIIDVKRLVTEFNMASGTTAVIGGLSRTEETQQDNGIPFLRKIPWIGPRLFGSMERVKMQKEIIVFVTVGLVNPREMKEDAGLPKNAVLGRQYTSGEKFEPGDREGGKVEGLQSLDLRTMDEQVEEPVMEKKKEDAKNVFSMSSLNPFQKDPNYKHE